MECSRGNPVFWAKTEPFTIGILPFIPPAKFSLHYLSRIATYVKSKEKLNIPSVNYEVWNYIACKKLSLSEDIAKIYFENFILFKHISERDLKKSSKNPQNQASVNLYKLLLFLYIQQIQKISLRSSLTYQGEEWPAIVNFPEKHSSCFKDSNEVHFHSFLLNNIGPILQMLNESGASFTDEMNLEAVEALDYLIEASISIDGNKCVRPILEIALMQNMQADSGYSKISQTFNIRKFEYWLRKYFGINPFSFSACLSSGTRLSWMQTGGDLRIKVNSIIEKSGRIATNAKYIKSKGNKMVIMSKVNKQTLLKCSSTITDAFITLHRCNNSHVYLLSSLRSVHIEKCKNSTFILGAVETIININQCENLTIISVCGRLIIQASSFCILYLLTPHQPIVLKTCKNIILAPYNTYYAMLEKNMSDTGLKSTPNLWNMPLSFGSNGIIEDTQNYTIMDPEDFYIFVVPFCLMGSTMNIPSGLSLLYKKAVIKKEKEIIDWQQVVRKKDLDEIQSKLFQNLVSVKFQAWLEYNGYKRHLDVLSVINK